MPRLLSRTAPPDSPEGDQVNPAVADLIRELADGGLFDEGVEAARNACVAGASIASAAITAAAWYDNPLTGAPAVIECMARLSGLPFEVEGWVEALKPRSHPETSDPEFSPGFGFVGAAQGEAIIAACARLLQARIQAAGGRAGAPRSAFFLEHRRAIEAAAGRLNQAGLAALVFLDCAVDRDEAERTFLVCRIETAIAEAQRARSRGLSAFPFFAESYVYEGPRRPERSLDLDAVRRKMGLV
jgi:hypothetical protein